MGLFNEHSSTSDTKSGVQGQGPQGPPGPKGDGYKIDASGNYDIENKKLTNVKNGDNDNDVMVKNQIEVYVSNKTRYLDGVNPGQVINNKAVIYSPSGSIHTNDLYLKDKNGQEVHFYNEDQDLNQCRLYVPNLKNNDSYGGRLKSDIMVTSIDQTIPGKKIFHDIEVPTPTIDGHASNKAYVDNSNAANKIYVDSEISKIPTIDTTLYLKKDGSIPMTGNLQMNGNNIIGLSNPPGADDQATNKKYVDDTITKANIKPSHTSENVFKYLMGNVNEFSSEYNVRVIGFSNLISSPHYWNKTALSISPLKDDDDNYRFRLGLQMFRLNTGDSYTLMIELFNYDYNTWQRQQTYINGAGLWVKSHNTTKFQHRYGSSGDLYYTKTLIKFKKTSDSAPVFIYYTIHYDDNGGDLNTYPDIFKNQVYIIAYGVSGETDHIDPEVYDQHKAFEIDKIEMKMLLPLNMDNNVIMNVASPHRELDAPNKKYVDDSIAINKRYIDDRIPPHRNTSDIYIHGMVDSNKFFNTTMRLTMINVHIEYIRFVIPKKYEGQTDTIKINRDINGVLRYSLTPLFNKAFVAVRINQFFQYIKDISLDHMTNIPFQLLYSVFY